jgi:lysozyme
MKTNAAGVELIKNAEGLRLESYLCPAGVWTIGYGHTGRSVLPASKVTEHQAEEILKVDLEKFERAGRGACTGGQ